jgi:hypothetical protein
MKNLRKIAPQRKLNDRHSSSKFNWLTILVLTTTVFEDVSHLNKVRCKIYAKNLGKKLLDPKAKVKYLKSRTHLRAVELHQNSHSPDAGMYSARQNCCNVLHLHKDNVITQEVDHFMLHNIYSHKALHLSYHMISIILCNSHFIVRYR